MTDEVNENEAHEDVAIKLFKLDFAYSDPTTGSVLISAPSEERAIEIALEAVPEHITDFRITDREELPPEALNEMLAAREEEVTVH